VNRALKYVYLEIQSFRVCALASLILPW